MLRLDEIVVKFGGVTAVRGVSLAIAAGEVVGLVGANGAGKTTLFNVISGLVKPTSGAATFAGHDLLRLPIHRRAHLGLARTFQIPQPLRELTVRQNLAVAQYFGAGRVDPHEAAEILEFVGLSEKADADAATELALSEQKALEVAKALATKPKLILLDEVLAGLETAAKRTFTASLQELRQRFHIGLVVIEHDLETIRTLCPRAVVFSSGTVIADGVPDEVFRDPQVVRSYTGAATS